MGEFAHLHVHSEYSLLDGACKIKELVKKVKDLGQSCVAVTDHGVMYGAIDFYKQAKKEGIKPIIGCEVYVAKRTRFDKVSEFDKIRHHLVLLCKDNEGYKNLIKMVSESWISGFYTKPRIDKDLLKEHSRGLIAMSACLAGEIPRLLAGGNYDEAKKCAQEYSSIFGENNFYLEVQDHGIEEQRYTNPMIARLSRETGIPMVATNDCHYIDRQDAYMHKILLCIQTNHTVNDENSLEFSSDQFYVKSSQEMEELFKGYDQAVENTVKIADMCNVEIEFGKTKLPHFEVPNNQNHFDYFKQKCYDGLYKNYGQNPSKEIVDRLEYELETINSMGYVDYYLIVWDFVAYAKSQGIPVGPGRGSGAGSLAAYAIGITGIDPLKYNLIFERFLNPERVSMPDFDIDFCYERRQEVIDYVIKKYGKDHVAQIVTFGTMAARAAIKDVGRAMAIPYCTTDKISKLIPNELGITLDKALEMSSDLRKEYSQDEKIAEFMDMSKKVEGMPRHASTHAAGVVITKDPVDNYVPLAKNDEAVVAQYTMTTLEEIGLLKMDFLGLRTLTVISDTEKMIKKVNPSFSIHDIKEDKQVFEMLSLGESEGVFQFESPGMKSVLSQLKPQKLEDLIAVISLYRPGPMESIGKYIENRHNPDKISYLHPMLSKILDVTYGCIVYQEQVMQIFRELAGYSAGRADIVRRAMSKKKADVMEHEKNIFIDGLTDEKGNCVIDGCTKRGVSREIAEKIFAQMQSFAAYAFNKSHAAAYALISYQTAWLKCKYPKEYMASLLTSVFSVGNKIFGYISECKRIGIEVLPPNINESEKGFTVSQNKIRFGLTAIKNISSNFIDNLLTERNNSGKFKSFYDFCKRMYGRDFNKRLLESLIKSGAMDSFGQNRRQMLMVHEKVVNNLANNNKKNLEGQIGFFDFTGTQDEAIEFPKVEEFPLRQLLSMEKEIISMYVSGHPLSEYDDKLRKIAHNKISNLISVCKAENRDFSENKVTLIAVISEVKLKITKNNTTMAFLKVEDLTGSIDVIVFPKAFATSAAYIKQESAVVIVGTVKSESEGEIKIVCDYIKNIEDFTPLSDKNSGEAKKQNSSPNNETKLYIRVKNSSCREYERAKLLISIFGGSTPVYIYFEEEKALKLSSRKMWVQLNEPLVNELKNQIGEKNVVIKN